jgi:AMMECR1 domain-containing protein/aromatic ring-opening dioxygenase LigB subunit
MIVFAGLMPHAPVLVPGVGHERVAQVRSTMRAMRDLAAQLVASRPGTLVVISPHSPVGAGAFGFWRTDPLEGSFAMFGSDAERVTLPLDAAFNETLEQFAAARGLRASHVNNGTLDHGAMVPLHYLCGAGWSGPAVVVGLGAASTDALTRLGEAMAATADALHRRVAILASGDMSHRLTFAAPCGYHAAGAQFDRLFIHLLTSGAAQEILRIDRELRDLAAEDVVASTDVALAATDCQGVGRRVLSYEGPFGVGYGVAVLYAPASEPASDPAGHEVTAAPAAVRTAAELPRVARHSVVARLEGLARDPPPVIGDELTAARGVFVTLELAANDELRGCRGSPVPRGPNLAWSTWHHAREAAFQDGRFAPVVAAELPALRFSVSVLDVLEPVGSVADLDPGRYGILVSSPDGRRRGLLLPGIRGIDSVALQLRLARQKAGLTSAERVTVERFTTHVYREELPLGTGGLAHAH